MLARLFQLRQKADYNCAYNVSDEEAKSLAEPSHQFVEKVTAVIEVSEGVFPHCIGVMQTNAAAQGIELVIGKADKVELDETFFGAMIQYPNYWGGIHDFAAFTAKCHELKIFVGVATDLYALTLLTPPGE